MFEVQLMFTLVVLVSVTTALAFGALIGWVLFERDNAPFKDWDDEE